MLNPFKQKRVKYDPSTYTKDYHKDKQCFSVTGGMQTSVPPIELPDFKLSKMYNCFFQQNEIKSRFGYVSFGAGLPLPDPIITIKQFKNYAGNSYLCVFTTKNVYKYNVSTECFDLITEHVDVCTCEAAWTASANVTATAATDWFRYGTKSAKIAIGADFATGLAAYFNFASLDISDATYLHFYIKSSVDTAAGDLQILLDDTNACATPVETLDVPALVANVAQEVRIALASPAGCAALLSIGLNVATDLGAMNVWLDDFTAPTCFTGEIEDRFSCDVIYNTTASEVLFVATNYIDPIKKWTGTGNWANLGGTPDNAKFLKNYYNYLVLGYCVTGGDDFPTKIEWSVNTKPEDWSGAGSGNNSLTSGAGGIKFIEEIQGQLAIFREQSITNMFIVAGVYEATQTPIPFEFHENKINDIGVPSGWTVKQFGDKLIFLGWDGVYIYDLYSFENINSENFTEFMGNVNPAQLALAYSVLLSEFSLYLLFVPSSGSTTTDLVWVFDYEKKICLGTWVLHDPISAVGTYDATSAEITIGDLTGTIGTFTWKIGESRPRSLFAETIIGDDSGYLYKLDKTSHSDNGNAIVSYFDTKAYAIKVGSFVRAVLSLIKMIGTDVEILVSTDGGSTFVSKQTETSVPADGIVKGRNVDTTCESIIFRFRVTALNSWFSIMGWVIRFIEKGKIP